MSTLQNELDYLKGLAESGARGPLRNGSTLFWAGLLYGLASIGQYAMMRGWLPASGIMSLFIWFGASLLFGVIAMIMRINCPPSGGGKTNRYAYSAWAAIGIAIVAFIASVVIIAYRMHDFEPMSYLLAPAVLIFYGIGWAVSALVSGKSWLRLVSFGSFLGALGLAAMAGQAEQLLAYAAALFVLAMLPGLALMREARQNG
jgi:hypothetical protein